MFWALQLVAVLVPGATFHLHTAGKSIIKNAFFKSPSTLIYIPSVLLRISLEVILFWLRIHLFHLQVKPLYLCDTGSLGGKTYHYKIHGARTLWEYQFYPCSVYIYCNYHDIMCCWVFEIIFRLCFLIKQWPKGWLPTVMPQLFSHHLNLFLPYSVSISIANINVYS